MTANSTAQESPVAESAKVDIAKKMIVKVSFPGVDENNHPIKVEKSVPAVKVESVLNGLKSVLPYTESSVAQVKSIKSVIDQIVGQIPGDQIDNAVLILDYESPKATIYKSFPLSFLITILDVLTSPITQIKIEVHNQIDQNAKIEEKIENFWE